MSSNGPWETKISKQLLDEFRSLERSNLESYWKDAKQYYEARKERVEEYERLMYRMRMDLMEADATNV
jgi:hypothetical protein